MKYVSLLRGINVSGQKKIAMSDLKSLYESLGFQDVVTYIQSGNVIFESTTKNKAALKAKIEAAIEHAYTFHVPVELRTSQELKRIINNFPFEDVDIIKDGTTVLVTFLSSKPASKKVVEIQRYVIAPEKLIVERTEVYLYCPNGYGKSKLSNTFLEQKLKIKATTRNWKSVLKLDELSM